ncbi:hypothetical protein ACFYZ9_35825 [Streptomyces sp. NPDC001691]|uniref:hypothetical protein n=1 Tax=Streptomyces sp. NPDC001691 TaxID=3364600 RepID=UPI00368825E7
MRGAPQPRLLLAVGIVMLSTGCVTMAHHTAPHGGGLVPEGGQLTTVATGPFWPDPVQPSGRETLTPAYGPATTPAVGGATGDAGPSQPPRHDRPKPVPAPVHHDDRPRTTTRHSPPPTRRHQSRPAYDPGFICSWAQGTGLDPSVVSACHRQLGR